MKRSLLLAVILASSANADTIVLNNGDKLTGTIGQVTAKSLKFTSPAFGEVTIPLANLTGYTFDSPVRVQPKGEPSVTGQVSGDAAGVTVDDRKYDFTQLRTVNSPKREWKGAVLANLALARGNTNKFTIGAEANAQLRRDDDSYDDRTTLNAGYNFGTSGGGPGGTESTTDTDNWNLDAKHDRFWSDRWYGYAELKLEHDRIAQLDYRITPGVGVGYQWIETPKINFYTEAGFNYIREKFTEGDSQDNVAVRFAYHYANQLNTTVRLFHNLEYLPALSDPGDYILNTDIGLRAKLTDSFFSQFKILYKRDSTPADESLKNDLLYTVGVGWEF